MSRCSICNIKVKLNYYECNCEPSIGEAPRKKFCSEHRFPFNHNCSIDYKKIHENKLSKFNPVVKPEKLESI